MVTERQDRLEHVEAFDSWGPSQRQAWQEGTPNSAQELDMIENLVFSSSVSLVDL
jgi:hypothetical protein